MPTGSVVNDSVGLMRKCEGQSRLKVCKRSIWMTLSVGIIVNI